MDSRINSSRIIIALAFVCLSICGKAQDSTSTVSLTLNEAIAKALLYNYDIRLAETNTKIAKINNTTGNAGMLPKINLNAGISYASTDINQKSASGTHLEYSPLNTASANAAIELDWTIFDGGKMFITKKKLNELQSTGELEFRTCVLQTTYDVIVAYNEVVRQQQIMTSIRTVIEYNRELLKIAQTKFNTGSTQKQDLLQTQIDLNINLQNEMTQLINIETAKSQLNLTMGCKADKRFEITDTIALERLPARDDLVNAIFTQNTSLQVLQKQINIAQLEVSETRSSYLPLISLRGGYYLNGSNLSAGPTISNRNTGPQIAGTLSIPLFNSGENKRKLDIAKFQQQAAEINLEEAKTLLEIQVINTFADYDNHLQLIANEIQINNFAKELLDLSVQRFRYGETTILEVHQAQENYINSQTRLLTYRFELKLIESRILQMASLF